MTTTDRWLRRAPYDGPEYRKARGPNGRRLCRWCGQEVPKGRQTWCSDDCVGQFTIRKWPSEARRRVLARDKGVCAACGLDTERLERILRRLAGWGRRDRERWLTAGGGRHWLARRRRLHDRLRQLGFDAPQTDSLWEADHIRPVAEGGGACGLDGYRTLCCRCHKAASAELAARLARGRRIDAIVEAADGESGW